MNLLFELGERIECLSIEIPSLGMGFEVLSLGLDFNLVEFAVPSLIDIVAQDIVVAGGILNLLGNIFDVVHICKIFSPGKFG